MHIMKKIYAWNFNFINFFFFERQIGSEAERERPCICCFSSKEPYQPGVSQDKAKGQELLWGLCMDGKDSK